jgi:hypothetical protein
LRSASLITIFSFNVVTRSFFASSLVVLLLIIILLTAPRKIIELRNEDRTCVHSQALGSEAQFPEALNHDLTGPEVAPPSTRG